MIKKVALSKTGVGQKPVVGQALPNIQSFLKWLSVCKTHIFPGLLYMGSITIQLSKNMALHY